MAVAFIKNKSLWHVIRAKGFSYRYIEIMMFFMVNEVFFGISSDQKCLKIIGIDSSCYSVAFKVTCCLTINSSEDTKKRNKLLIKTKNWIFRGLPVTGSVLSLEKTINEFSFRSFWGVFRLPTTNGSRDLT